SRKRRRTAHLRPDHDRDRQSQGRHQPGADRVRDRQRPGGRRAGGKFRPAGRLTGVHYLVRDLTAKRLEVLKEILPKLSRVLTFYDPNNRVASEGAAMAREEGKRAGIRMIERYVGSVTELKSELQKLKAGEADAFLFTPDPMIGSESQSI